MTTTQVRGDEIMRLIRDFIITAIGAVASVYAINLLVAAII